MDKPTAGDIAFSMASSTREKSEAILKRLDELEKRVEELEWKMNYHVLDAEG